MLIIELISVTSLVLVTEVFKTIKNNIDNNKIEKSKLNIYKPSRCKIWKHK